jgi:hypothetical protein
MPGARHKKAMTAFLREPQASPRSGQGQWDGRSLPYQIAGVSPVMKTPNNSPPALFICGAALQPDRPGHDLFIYSPSRLFGWR